MKRITLRQRSGQYFCTIYATKIGGTIWSIGLVINKSKRASNNWYTNRRNKRSKRVKNESRIKALKDLRVCLNLMRRMIKTLPPTADLIIHNDFKEAEALSKYVERLGFIPVYQSGYLVWVLTALKKAEAPRRCERTTL